METLFAFGMLVGLMKGHADPPRAAPFEQPQAEQRPAGQRHAAAENAPSQKSSNWPLDY